MKACFAEGRKVCLRPVEAADSPTIFRWKSDPFIRRMAGDPAVPVQLEDERQDIERSAGACEQLYLMVVLRETEQPIGYVRVNWMDAGHRSAWLRFALGEHRGHGYASDAIQCLLARLFREGTHRVDAEAYEFNHASLRLLERLGFRREGVRREAHFDGQRYADVVAFGLLEADFRHPERGQCLPRADQSSGPTALSP